LKRKADSFRTYVEDQLGEGMTFRPMFGGVGISRGDAFFGIVFKGRLYFRTGPLTRKDYVERGMKPFKPSARQTLKSYYEVPADVLEDADTLRSWALRASRIK
jgi:DNA transformation protein